MGKEEIQILNKWASALYLLFIQKRPHIFNRLNRFHAFVYGKGETNPQATPPLPSAVQRKRKQSQE